MNEAPADTSSAWKFELEDTINGDPELPPASLNLMRVYLNFASYPKALVYSSITDMMAKTGLSASTIRETRKSLIQIGYMVEKGRNNSGVTLYELRNVRKSYVEDLIRSRVEELREEDKGRKRNEREKAASRHVVPPKIDTPASLSKTVPPADRGGGENRRDVPPNSEGMSLRKTIPNTVEYSVDNTETARRPSGGSPRTIVYNGEDAEIFFKTVGEKEVVAAASDEARNLLIDHFSGNAGHDGLLEEQLKDLLDRVRFTKSAADRLVEDTLNRFQGGLHA